MVSFCSQMHLLVSHTFEKIAVCCGGLKAFSTFIVLKINVYTAADGGRGVVGDNCCSDNGATYCSWRLSISICIAFKNWSIFIPFRWNSFHFIFHHFLLCVLQKITPWIIYYALEFPRHSIQIKTFVIRMPCILSRLKAWLLKEENATSANMFQCAQTFNRFSIYWNAKQKRKQINLFTVFFFRVRLGAHMNLKCVSFVSIWQSIWYTNRPEKYLYVRKSTRAIKNGIWKVFNCFVSFALERWFWNFNKY